MKQHNETPDELRPIFSSLISLHNGNQINIHNNCCKIENIMNK